ncbi:hypothetical protein [Natrinema versiforme]|uniref:hypothetical protein n=1 Tax=Natrinema versiforme TaxID=88724 RepID=UPI0015865222|nr:hypothetical protein [Natrinema versiforme]
MSELVAPDETTPIDRTIGLEDGAASEPTPPSIGAFGHETSTKRLDGADAKTGGETA